MACRRIRLQRECRDLAVDPMLTIKEPFDQFPGERQKSTADPMALLAHPSIDATDCLNRIVSSAQRDPAAALGDTICQHADLPGQRQRQQGGEGFDHYEGCADVVERRALRTVLKG